MTPAEFFAPRLEIRAAYRGAGQFRVTLRRLGAAPACWTFRTPAGALAPRSVTFDYRQAAAPAEDRRADLADRPTPCAIVDTIRHLLAEDSRSGARMRNFLTAAEVALLGEVK